jgi:hypothetical protein
MGRGEIRGSNMKYKVYGTVKVGVEVTVDADDEESAIDAAYEEFGGLSGYCGNGGTNQLVGVNNPSVALDVGEDPGDFTEVEPA